MGQSLFKSNVSETETNDNDKVLTPKSIRWFYEGGNQIWIPLTGPDSLAIENGYRKHEEMLKVVTTSQATTSAANAREGDNSMLTNWANTAVALGGYYQLAFDENATSFRYHLKPLYSKGSNIRLRRGIWFMHVGGENWQPLDVVGGTSLVELVEAHHVTLLDDQSDSGQTNTDDVVDASGSRVHWRNVNDVRLFDNRRSSALQSIFGTSRGQRLLRGYPQKASIVDSPSPVSDVVFVIHGIGQKETPGQIASDVNKIRELSETLMRRNFADTNRRPMYLPIDWRTDLDLNEDLLKIITPKKCEWSRGLVVNQLVDILYYANLGGHGATIIESLCNCLNRAFKTFVDNEPGFLERQGNIHLAAHSLGSVISFDLLCAQSGFAAEVFASANVPGPRLDFSVKTLFMVGSPLALFVATRQKRQRPVILPDASFTFRIFNIFYMADVVVFRIEPLFSPPYASIYPLRVHNFDSSNQYPYENMSLSPMAKVAPESTSALVPQEQVLPSRIDYALRPDRQFGSGLKAAVMAHCSYWENANLTNFILSTLYGAPKIVKKAGSIKA